MALPEDSFARYLAVADGFGSLVHGTRDWGAQSPVPQWQARDVVWHLVDWIPDVLQAGAKVQLPRRDPLKADPVGDWERFDAGLRTLVAQPGIANAEFAHPQAGSMPLGTAIDMLITPDVFMHSWDLAQASEQEFALDPDFAAGLYAGMQGIDEMLRASGQYGPRVPVPDDADAQTRLMAFVGRDPDWRSTQQH